MTLLNWALPLLVYGFMAGILYSGYVEIYEDEKKLFGRVPWFFPVMGFVVVVFWPVAILAVLVGVAWKQGRA